MARLRFATDFTPAVGTHRARLLDASRPGLRGPPGERRVWSAEDRWRRVAFSTKGSASVERAVGSARKQLRRSGPDRVHRTRSPRGPALCHSIEHGLPRSGSSMAVRAPRAQREVHERGAHCTTVAAALPSSSSHRDRRFAQPRGLGIAPSAASPWPARRSTARRMAVGVAVRARPHRRPGQISSIKPRTSHATGALLCIREQSRFDSAILISAAAFAPSTPCAAEFGDLSSDRPSSAQTRTLVCSSAKGSACSHLRRGARTGTGRVGDLEATVALHRAR